MYFEGYFEFAFADRTVATAGTVRFFFFSLKKKNTALHTA